MGRFERRQRAASRKHWATLIACVALIVIAMWIALGESATPGVVLLPAPPRPAAGEVVVAPTTSPDTTVAQMQIAPPQVDRSGQVEVCGVGWVAKDADGGVDPAVLERVAGIEAERRRLMSALTTSDDEFERAAVLWLQALQTAKGGLVVGNPTATCEGEACAFSTVATTPSDGPLEQLAQHATTTRDPRVYALAFKACKNSQARSCSLLTSDRWAQLDGDNGDPWLYVLAEAVERHDTAQAEEAIHRLGTAPRVDMRFFEIPRAIAEHAGSSDAALQVASTTAVLAIGRLAATPFSSIQPLTRRCRGAELGDANRRQSCDAVASALAERSDNMFYSAIGVAIGRQLGWSEGRIDAVRSLSVALAESAPTQEIGPLTWSCKSIATMLKHMSRQGVVGETGFAREWIVASGSTLERYAALEAERRQRRFAVSNSAASAAQAAASVSGEGVASGPLH